MRYSKAPVWLALAVLMFNLALAFAQTTNLPPADQPPAEGWSAGLVAVLTAAVAVVVAGVAWWNKWFKKPDAK